MKIGLLLALVLSMSLLFLACSKGNNDEITISGITERNYNGELTGDFDATDWLNDNNFSEKINSLFIFEDTVNYETSKISTVEIVEYPNPVENIFYLHFNLSDDTVIKFVIVDESLKVYFKYASKLKIGNNLLAIQAEKLPRNKYFRIYYAFYDNSKTIYYRGHGDIKKK
ncbi:MAG: hypothetical protein AB7S48_01025 [Bacteroidales bacterium]